MLAGSLYGFTGVALGAFAAHGLAGALELREATDIWETAVKYQMWHAIALILLPLIEKKSTTSRAAGYFFIVGTAVFSGTLYGIGLGGPRWLGAITPIGGLSLLAGWLFLILSTIKNPASWK